VPPRPASSNRWGRWTYDPEWRTLSHEETPYYQIDLEKIRTARDVVDWLAHLSKKMWVTREDLGELVCAFHELLDFYALKRGAPARLPAKEGGRP
jgi:hypothetical protein